MFKKKIIQFLPFDATQNKVIEPKKQKKPKSFRSNKAFMRKNKKENQEKRSVKAINFY